MTTNSLYSIAEIRTLEAKAIGLLGEFELMQRAGKYAADWVKTRFPSLSGEILIVVGCGNNGGDALVLALELIKAKYSVRIITNADITQLPVAAKQAWTNLFESPSTGLVTQNFDSFLQNIKQTTQKNNVRLIVDGLFGIGLRRPIAGIDKLVVDAINQLSENGNIPVLALDTPSGIDVDRGIVLSAPHESGSAIRATRTVTFLADKCGLYTGEACDYVGKVRVADLGINSLLKSKAKIQRNTPSSIPKRQKNSHKGSHGSLYIIGGSEGMQGAIHLAARAARYAGAGKIFLCPLGKSPLLDPNYPELMFASPDHMWSNNAILAAGPGMGQKEDALDVLARILQHPAPIVLDADALNLIANSSELQSIVKKRSHGTILTPHPLEAGRLLGCSIKEIQQDRFLAVKKLAHTFNAHVVLKGSGTLICNPIGKISVNTTGNPVLACAGSGDLLTGIIAALLAQNLSAENAVALGVWAHGKAADDFVKQSQQNLSYTSTELLSHIRYRLQNIGDV